MLHGHRILGPYPCRFGHETAGVREDTGERVLVGDSVACGACAACRARRAQLCRDLRWVVGGFAQWIAAPEAALHRVPEGLPAAGAAMAEPLAAAVHAVGRADDVPAGVAAVVGGGAMGLMLARLLVLGGRSVTVADPHAERREQALALGADAAVAVLEPRRFGLVLEAVGRAEAWCAALAAAAPGGTVVLVGGCPAGTDVALPAAPLHYDEIDLRGAFHHDRAEVDAALQLLACGRMDWRALAGETVGLDGLAERLRAPARGPACKLVVDPWV
jgi:L-iditol 2-dehydrogenase